MTLTAVLTPAAEGGYVAFNPETGTTSQGETVDEAMANLKEATELYLEEFPVSPTGKALLTTFEVGRSSEFAPSWAVHPTHPDSSPPAHVPR